MTRYIFGGNKIVFNSGIPNTSRIIPLKEIEFVGEIVKNSCFAHIFNYP